jgi:hypothetical protein
MLNDKQQTPLRTAIKEASWQAHLRSKEMPVLRRRLHTVAPTGYKARIVKSIRSL